MDVHQATPGTVLNLESAWMPLGSDRMEQTFTRATVVRWEGRGDGTARLLVRIGRQVQHGGIFGPDHVFKLWPEVDWHGGTEYERAGRDVRDGWSKR